MSKEKIQEIIIRNNAQQIANCLLPKNEEESELIKIFNEVLKCINKELEEFLKEPTLEEENFNLRLKLNAEEECAVMLKKRIEELKSTIDILKDKFFIDIIERENDYKIGFLPKTPIKNGIETRFAQLDNDKANTIIKALEEICQQKNIK